MSDPVADAKKLLAYQAIYQAAFETACMQRTILQAYLEAGFEKDVALHFVDKWMDLIAKKGIDYAAAKPKTV